MKERMPGSGFYALVAVWQRYFLLPDIRKIFFNNTGRWCGLKLFKAGVDIFGLIASGLIAKVILRLAEDLLYGFVFVVFIAVSGLAGGSRGLIGFFHGQAFFVIGCVGNFAAGLLYGLDKPVFFIGVFARTGELFFATDVSIGGRFDKISVFVAVCFCLVYLPVC